MIPDRQKTVVLTIAFCYLAIVIKLFYIQIIRYPELSKQLLSQSFKTSTIKPEMGSILDNQGLPLVSFQTLFQASIYKPDLKIKTDTLTQLLTSKNSHLLQSDIDKLNKFVQNDKQKWLTLSGYFDLTETKEINDPGIVFTKASQLKLSEGNLGGLFLGSGGLAGYYKRQISGKTGFSWETKDAVGNTILTHPGWIIDPVKGADIPTYINRQIQHLVETTLADGIKQFSADSGEILMMDPRTGGIIAMTAQTASSSSEASASAIATSSATTLVSNPIIANLFEPGSIVKPLVMTLALDSNSIKPDFICTKCDRPNQIGQYAISNWDSSFHANSDLKSIIKNSDNIGMSYIIKEVELDNFLKYFKLLGLDRKTGIDLPGEGRPLQKNYWPEIDLATASFGQGFAVTQVQMLAAFNTIANNGVRVNPHFNQNQKIISTKVYDQKSIDQIKSILKYGVENGVVAKFKPDTLEVCGKSGTSQVAIKGGYSDSTTIASYIGFSPCQNPEFTMIVTIHNPKTSPWGSSTAAPIWYKIAENLPLLL